MGSKPGLRARDQDVIRRARSARDAARLNAVLEGLGAWLPTVRRWTVGGLRRTVHRFTDEGIAERSLLDREPSLSGDDRL